MDHCMTLFPAALHECQRCAQRQPAFVSLPFFSVGGWRIRIQGTRTTSTRTVIDRVKMRQTPFWYSKIHSNYLSSFEDFETCAKQFSQRNTPSFHISRGRVSLQKILPLEHSALWSEVTNHMPPSCTEKIDPGSSRIEVPGPCVIVGDLL